MSLREYVKPYLLPVLERLLAWAKRNHAYFGNLQADLQRDYDANLSFVRYRYEMFIKKIR